jgi:hypothetical protein
MPTEMSMNNNSFHTFFFNFFLISIFFSDWGFFYRDATRPLISFTDLATFFFIVVYGLRLMYKAKFTKDSIFVLILLFTIIIISYVGIFFFNRVPNFSEFYKSSAKLILWAVFIFIWLNTINDLDLNKNKLLNTYMIASSIIGLIAIGQYTFYQTTGIALDFHLFKDQKYGSIIGNFRATSIFLEPSYLGVHLLIPLLISAYIILFNEKKNKIYLIHGTVIFFAILISFSLGSYLILVLYSVFVYLRLLVNIKNGVKYLQRFYISNIIIFLLLSVLTYVLYDLIFIRFESEVIPLIERGIWGIQNTSIYYRSLSFIGFFKTLELSPIFGFGFDQIEYMNRLLIIPDFEVTTSGTLGFIGISSGLLGLSVFGIFFFTIFKGGSDNRLFYNVRLGFIVGLILIHTFIYAGILNADFWVLLAYGHFFSNKKQF